MPNTLCHIAIQAPLSRRFISPGELTWVLIGCLIPDLPWIGLKLLLATNIFNPYDLRLYFTAQASLLLCLVLAGTIAMFARKSSRVFLIIGVNAMLHLLLDGLQIKWGNGINVIAPLDWKLVRLDLFWPEHLLTMGLSVFGLAYLLFIWPSIVKGSGRNRKNISLPSPAKAMASVLLAALYLSAPVLFMEDMERADTYFIGTMKQKEQRPGKHIEFDRAHYNAQSKEIEIYSGEVLKVDGPQPERSGRVSFKGRFITADTIASDQYHYHRDFRDLASMVGIFLTCTLLLQTLILGKFTTNK